MSLPLETLVEKRLFGLEAMESASFSNNATS